MPQDRARRDRRSRGRKTVLKGVIAAVWRVSDQGSVDKVVIFSCNTVLSVQHSQNSGADRSLNGKFIACAHFGALVWLQASVSQ
jgi:hypothetical protein